jgi:hypothetical protein
MAVRLSLRLAAWVLLLSGPTACSDQFEVGAMDRLEPFVSAGGSASAGPDEQAAGQAGSEADPLDTCEPGKPPPALTGPFATPDVVWQRIAQILSDGPLEPPSPLPSVTTYEWAGDIATEAFAHAIDNDEPAPGAELFVPRFLRLPEGAAKLSNDWPRQLLSNMPVLDVLLLTQLPDDTRRVGIFTEPVWLKQFPAIATRGYVFASSALGSEVPPEPGDITMRQNPNLDSSTSRRQAELANSAQNACAPCHSLVDPLGFSLEHFDGLGNYQETDGSKPVNSSGTYTVPHTTREIVFDDNVNLSQQLVYVCEANLGMASSYLTMALERSHVPSEERDATHEASLKRFEQAFVGNGRSYRALVTAWAQSPIVLSP